MKTIITLAAVFLSLTAFKSPDPVNESVLKEFLKSYPNATETKWYQGNNYYQVNFRQNGIRSVIYFNSNDQIYKTLRYYNEKDLSPFIGYKIREKYPNKKIKGIAELTGKEGVLYEVTVEDQKSLYVIHADDSGNLKTVNKFKKA